MILSIMWLSFHSTSLFGSSSSSSANKTISILKLTAEELKKRCYRLVHRIFFISWSSTHTLSFTLNFLAANLRCIHRRFKHTVVHFYFEILYLNLRKKNTQEVIAFAKTCVDSGRNAPARWLSKCVFSQLYCRWTHGSLQPSKKRHSAHSTFYSFLILVPKRNSQQCFLLYFVCVFFSNF